MRKVLLIILDGWGEGKRNYANPIHLAKKEFLDYLREHYSFFLLQASGIAVGLPWQEEGNSEVGHFTIGTGQIFYQNYPRITLSIKNGDFFQNPILQDLISHANKYHSRIHLIGLLTSGIIHASFEHLIALLKFFKINNFFDVYLHLFLDGRDSPPRSGLELLEQLEKYLTELKVAKIATLCGRTYGMDSNEYWKIKTQVAFYLITEGVGKFVENYKDYLQNLYSQQLDFIDENLEPLVVDKEGIIQDNDAILFFNFRGDGMYQLAKAFLDPEFKEFQRPVRNNLYIASLIKYLEEIDYPVVFPKQEINTSLSKVISEYKLNQLKIAEKYKSYHLTYCFNGFIEEPHPGEFWKILPSRRESFQDNPLLQGQQITEIIINAIQEEVYSFIAANYSAPDIIGHTGNINLGIKVVEGINDELRKIYEFLKNKDEWAMIITSDHGNLEEMLNLERGERDTVHNFNPVPCYIISSEFFIEKKDDYYKIKENQIRGTIADIAPTILKLMGLPIPPEMIGKPLI